MTIFENKNMFGDIELHAIDYFGKNRSIFGTDKAEFKRLLQEEAVKKIFNNRIFLLKKFRYSNSDLQNWKLSSLEEALNKISTKGGLKAAIFIYKNVGDSNKRNLLILNNIEKDLY